MSETSECIKHHLGEIRYQLDGLLNEYAKGKRGEYFSQEYVNEKCETIDKVLKIIEIELFQEKYPRCDNCGGAIHPDEASRALHRTNTCTK